MKTWIKSAAKVLALMSVFNIVSVYHVEACYAEEGQAIASPESNPSAFIRALDRQISRTESEKTKMSEFIVHFSKNFNRSYHSIENKIRRHLKRAGSTETLKQAMLQQAQGSGLEEALTQKMNQPEFSLEKDVVNPYFTNDRLEQVKAEEIAHLNQYEYLSDYLKDLREQVASSKVSTASVSKIFKKVGSRSPASETSFFLCFIGGLLLVCIGGIIGIFFPPAGLVIMLVGIGIGLVGAATASKN